MYRLWKDCLLEKEQVPYTIWSSREMIYRRNNETNEPLQDSSLKDTAFKPNDNAKLSIAETLKNFKI